MNVCQSAFFNNKMKCHTQAAAVLQADTTGLFGDKLMTNWNYNAQTFNTEHMDSDCVATIYWFQIRYFTVFVSVTYVMLTMGQSKVSQNVHFHTPTPVLSNWLLAGHIRPATTCNKAREVIC